MKTNAEKERAADRKLEEADEILLCKRQMRQNVCFGWEADVKFRRRISGSRESLGRSTRV